MEYRVLARKYRPTNFDDLIGQEVLVRTLSNAMESGRIAHAFLLTGIRGIGKTTTARIIARALNCEQGPTIKPCGVCSQCVAIAEDRNMDVLEIDAASHTGVGDMRELIDSVRYLPTAARYKIYIIDEVHMLSNSAFNALLKTLEEPPPHVKFVFATTEARKIPVTILSRCQRFDLKRISGEMLATHLANICEKEAVKAEPQALALISIAAEGSVRDSLSLLDQAIARASGADGAHVSEALVRQMIGAADHGMTFRLLDTLLAGDVAGALAHVKSAYHDGMDPLLMVQDALEITHLITRMKVAPNEVKSDITLSENDRTQAFALAEKLTMPILARLWQMLLKGVQEIRMAPQPLAAWEMLLVRVGYAANLPTPAEVLRSEEKPTSVVAPTIAATQPVVKLASVTVASINDFSEMVALFETNREPLLYTQLMQDAKLVSFMQGQVVFQSSKSLPRDFAAKIGECLARWTGQTWKIIFSDEQGAAPLREQQAQAKQQKMESVAGHPLVSSVLEQFPGAQLVGVSQNA